MSNVAVAFFFSLSELILVFSHFKVIFDGLIE